MAITRSKRKVEETTIEQINHIKQVRTVTVKTVTENDAEHILSTAVISERY